MTCKLCIHFHITLGNSKKRRSAREPRDDQTMRKVATARQDIADLAKAMKELKEWESANRVAPNSQESKF